MAKGIVLCVLAALIWLIVNVVLYLERAGTDRENLDTGETEPGEAARSERFPLREDPGLTPVSRIW